MEEQAFGTTKKELVEDTEIMASNQGLAPVQEKENLITGSTSGLRIKPIGDFTLPMPKIEVSTNLIDFGLRTKIGREYGHRPPLKITNVGDGVLNITKMKIISLGSMQEYPTKFYFVHETGIRPSIDYSPLPLILKPGEFKLINVVFYPDQLGMVYEGILTIESNAINNPVKISLRGMTPGRVCSVHSEYIDFGVLGPNDPPVKADIIIESQGTTDLEVYDPLYNPGVSAFSFDNKPNMPLILPPGTKATFQAVFSYTAPGKYTTMLEIRSNDDVTKIVPPKVRVKGACK